MFGVANAELILLRVIVQLKKMVVGTRGAVIGEIGIAARKELIALLKRNVHLVLPVKVSKHAL